MQKQFCLRHSFFSDPKSCVFRRGFDRLEVKLCSKLWAYCPRSTTSTTLLSIRLVCILHKKNFSRADGTGGC